ncbi:MAG: hypothetical protein MJ142_06370 [Clostridia bacterium]|nr:hypothetical protein [Clostridia bacterium]
MGLEMTVTHYYHSGFSVACDDIILIFDYWLGEENELRDSEQITAAELEKYNEIYVFISHEHIDHLDPVVYTWRDQVPVMYIVSSDMPVGTRGKRMAPGEFARLSENVSVRAFDSTDLGVSFLVDIKGIRVFHAGDLNFWHWRDESTAADIAEAEEEYTKVLHTLEGQDIDVCMFPVDPRQGGMYDAGANYFILTVKPRLMIPMHYFHRGDIAMEFARRARCRTTEVLAMPGYGDRIRLSFHEDGDTEIRYVSVHPQDGEEEVTQSDEFPIESGNDPFAESDMPVPLSRDNDHE